MDDINESMKTISPEFLIGEILKMDRLLYLRIIKEKGSLKSLQVTREILAIRKNLKPEQIGAKEANRKNPNINKRLQDMVGLGILDVHKGRYSLSPIGHLLVDELTRLNSNIEILGKYEWFFNTHDYSVIPSQQFREIYKLQFAEQCENNFDYRREIERNTGNTSYGIHIATEYLHDIPTWIIDELRQNHLTLKLTYQFKKPFKINSNDEEELKLWRNLIQDVPPGLELRYSILKDRNPIGIRIIDDKWAIFSLYEKAEKKLNRPRSFYGTHEQFVAWIKNVFLDLWNKSKSFKRDEISEILSFIQISDL